MVCAAAGEPPGILCRHFAGSGSRVSPVRQARVRHAGEFLPLSRGEKREILTPMTLSDATRTDDGVVSPRADRLKRRTFTAEYERSILSEYEAADRSEWGATRRREGPVLLPHLEWRKAAAASGLERKDRDRRSGDQPGRR